MKARFISRHCYVKTEYGRTAYYAYYGGQSVRIEKELYDFLNISYSQERHKKETERKHVCVSIDQLYDEMMQVDRHGIGLPSFRVESAEEKFFDLQNTEEQSNIIAQVKEEIEHLSLEERELILSFVNESSIIEKLAEKYNITKRAVYYRRRKLADQIAANIRKGIADESYMS